LSKNGPKNIPFIEYNISLSSLLVQNVLRLLDATLSIPNIEEENFVKGESLRSDTYIHPLSMPLPSSSSSSTLFLELLLKALFTEHECGCSIVPDEPIGKKLKEKNSSASFSSLSSSASGGIEQHKYQSIASLLYGYYISSFHLTFPPKKTGEKDNFPDLNAELTSRPMLASLISRVLHRLRYLLCYCYGRERGSSFLHPSHLNVSGEKKKEDNSSALLMKYLNQIGVVLYSENEVKEAMENVAEIQSLENKKKQMKEESRKRIQEEMERKQRAFMMKMMEEENNGEGEGEDDEENVCYSCVMF
jgi:hypothetical protein